MERSESIKALSMALAKFHSQVGKIAKDAKNPFFKSNYASLSHILQEVSEPLQSAGLVIAQFPDGTGLVTMLIHSESGEYISSNYTMPVAKQNDPQAVGSAITYARRYAVSSILSLNVSDDDGNAAAVQPKKQTLQEGAQLDAAIKYMQDGGSIAAVEAKYILTQEIRNLLTQNAK
jgi:hypothetical protein